MGKWVAAFVAGVVFLTGMTFAQDNTYLQLVVEGLSGKAVDDAYPNIAGVGVNFAAMALADADIISAQVRLVGNEPATGEVQAGIYIKTGSAYEFFAATDVTNLVSGQWVEVASSMEDIAAVNPDSVMEIGIKLTTSDDATFTGNIRIDDVMIKKAAGNDTLYKFTDGVSKWEEKAFGELGLVIKGVTVPGVTAEPTGKNLVVHVEGLDGAGVVDPDLDTETWPNLGGVGKAYPGETGTDRFTDATAISVQVMVTNGDVTDGEVQGRIYMKTGSGWTWSSTSEPGSFTTLKKDKWVTINIPIADFDSDPIEDVANVREIGLQFQTYNLVFTGDLLIDDVVIKKASGNDTLFNFEFGTDGWSEKQVCGDEYIPAKIVKSVDVPGLENTGEGGAMWAEFLGLSGESVTEGEEETWPYQCGLATVTTSSFDFTGKNRISILLFPGQEILPGGELRAQFYVKAGEYVFSEGPYYILKGQQWNRIEGIISEFSPAIEALDDIKTIGIKFYTQQMEYSGKIYFDNLKFDDEDQYTFDSEIEIVDWDEDDMGQIMKKDGGTIFVGTGWVESIPDPISVKTGKVSHKQAGFSVAQNALGKIDVSFSLKADQMVHLAVFDIAGRSVLSRSVQAKAGKTTMTLGGLSAKGARGMYTIALRTVEGVQAKRICIVK